MYWVGRGTGQLKTLGSEGDGIEIETRMKIETRIKIETKDRDEDSVAQKNGLLFIVTDKAWAFKNGFAHAPHVCFIQILKNTSGTVVSFLRTRVDHVIFIS